MVSEPENCVKPTLLIVEDDAGLQSQLRWHFDQYNVVLASDRESAITALRRDEPSVVLQDLGLPPDDEGVEEGFASLRDLIAIAPCTKVIVITGHHETENAIRAISMGAYDFYEKPVQTDILDLIVQRAFRIHDLEKQNRFLQLEYQAPLQGIIASDPAMMRICNTIERVAPTNATCLLLGQSGTGKEILAKAVHKLSPYRDKRFVAINCAAVPENLMESELFGYERGAFTGANKRSLGKVELAHKGTLFLDEIGDMPLSLQAKILRFLQEREIERLGGKTVIPVEVRVVCATNKNLEELVAQGVFRDDLFYRISEIVIHIPPLSERGGDRALLARHLLQKFTNELQKPIGGYTPEAMSAIETYQWPGNVREMENKIRRAVIMSDDRLITAQDLGLAESSGPCFNLRQIRIEAEISAINTVLSFSAGNISAAAKLLGITRPTLYDLVKKHNIHLEPE